jgi:hypothetical protein
LPALFRRSDRRSPVLQMDIVSVADGVILLRLQPSVQSQRSFDFAAALQARAGQLAERYLESSYFDPPKKTVARLVEARRALANIQVSHMELLGGQPEPPDEKQVHESALRLTGAEKKAAVAEQTAFLMAQTVLRHDLRLVYEALQEEQLTAQTAALQKLTDILEPIEADLQAIVSCHALRNDVSESSINDIIRAAFHAKVKSIFGEDIYQKAAAPPPLWGVPG